MKLDTHELAWAAGFFDGEGCTSNRSNSNLMLQISQNHIEPLERFKFIVGVGTVKYYERWRKDNGKLHGYYLYYVGNFEHIQYTIALLWKYLCPIKRKQYIKLSKIYLFNCRENNMSMLPKNVNQRKYIRRKSGRIEFNRLFTFLPKSKFINPFEQKEVKDYEIVEVS